MEPLAEQLKHRQKCADQLMASLEKIIEKEHQATKESGFKCSKCERSYKNIVSLYRHEAAVHKKPKYKCGICGKTFGSGRKERFETHRNRCAISEVVKK